MAGPPVWLLRVTALVAMLGGLLALGVATLVVVSVLGRWLADQPVEGDFEFVKMATAIAVFTFLPFTQSRRANVLVDTFTGKLSPRAQDRIDAFWDIVFAAVMATCATGLTIGMAEARLSGESTMQLQLLVWPVIGVCALLAWLLVLTAAMTGIHMARRLR